ncbi:MAG: hypothetical protein HXY25_09065, partial [Alphaproteobacteria bacterium]|nr:hypothetical protein [Alphaproteobacteria bacterium]
FENTGLGLFFNTNFKYEIDTDNFRADGRPGTDTRKRWNARIGIEGQNWGHGWQLQAFGNNIFDVDYERTRTVVGTFNFFHTYEARSSFGIRLSVTGGDDY